MFMARLFVYHVSMLALSSLVLSSLFVLPARGATYHDITIDGNIADWNADEKMGTRNSCNFYVSWNATHVFIGWNGTNWAGDGDLHIYMNTTLGGSSTSKAWNGVNTLPFEADFLFWVEDGSANNFGLDQYSGTWSPVPASGISQYIGWSGNPNTELAIPRSLLGNPTSMGIMAYALWESEGKVWNAFPTENPASQTGSETFTAYYQLDLSPGVSPIACPVVISQPANMVADGNFGDWQSNYNESTSWDKFYISWNATHLFLGWNGTIWAGSGDLMIYLNTTNGGSAQGMDWSGVHTLPFSADYLFWIEDGNAGCFGLKKYEASWVSTAYTGASFIGWSGNPNTEIFIPLSELGNPSKVGIVAFAQWESSCNIWRAYPAANQALNSGQQAFTDYYDCTLSSAHANTTIVTDDVPPSITFIAPTNGETIVTSEYAIKASAHDNIAVAKVEVSFDSSPYANMTWSAVDNAYTYDWLGYSSGIHTLSSRATDAKGNVKITTITVTYSPGGLDTVPPTVTIDFPSNNEVIYSLSYEIKSRATDNVGVTMVQIAIDGGAYSTMYYISQEARWGFLWGGYSVGMHNITVKAYDAAGNEGTRTARCTYDPAGNDTTSPSVTIDYPTASETITSASYTVKAMASDNVGIASVAFRADAGGWQAMSWNSYESRWTYLWSGYSEGVHTLAVRAFDVAGNNATATVSVNYAPAAVDTIRPVAYIDHPTPGEVLVSPSYEIKAHATDNVGVTLMQVAIDGGAWNGMWYDSTEDRWAFHWEYYPEGNHTIIVRAFDSAGNNGSTAVSCSYSTSSQDATPPTVTIEYPTPGEVIVSPTYEIKARASDNVGVSRVAISIDGSAFSDMTNVGDNYAYSWSGYAIGSHEIMVKAWDASNNTGTSFTTATYTPSGDDTVPPQVFVESPTPNQIITMSGFPVRARASDNVAVSTVKVRFDDSVWLDMTQSSGTWTYSWSTYSEGMHNISVRATDSSGNNATATVSCFYYIDDSAPVVQISSHSDGQAASVQTIMLTGTSSDDTGIVRVEACASPSGWSGQLNWINCSGTSYWVVRLTLAPGNNTVRVRATDLAGKITNVTITLRYGSVVTPDVTPPVVSFTSPMNGTTLSAMSAVISGSASDDRGLASLFLKIGNANAINITDCLSGASWTYMCVFDAQGAQVVELTATDHSGNTASAYLHITINIPVANSAPTLGSALVYPSKGTTSTTFSFKVSYVDKDGTSPAYVNVVIDGEKHNMTYMSGTNVDGAVYEYRAKLRDGSHRYYFEASDGKEEASLDDAGSPFALRVDKPKSSPGYNTFALLVALALIGACACALARRRV